MIEFTIEHSSNNIYPLTQTYIDLLVHFCQEILKEFHYDQRFCSILICDNLFIAKLNKTYRNKEEATDVLSFAFDDDEFLLPHSALGDIIISSEKALSQATEFQVSYEEEFARLTIHGILHLLGYDHELGEQEHQEMFALQDRYMNTFMQQYNGSNSTLI
ncbi:MAG: rRNA maturation RNase YbeY [Brevinema sp.]